MRLFFAGLLVLTIAGPSGATDRVVAYSVVDARAIPDSLTGQAGDPQAGRALYLDEKLARCAGCHGVPDDATAPRTEVQAGGGPAGRAPEAPPLDDVGQRLGQGAIRLWLVAPQVVRPGTAMPAFYAIGQRDDPADPRFGEPLLTASEIEDLVAYLSRQTGEAETGRP
jgi:L-cysteine S-thiosulfotransferase